MEFSKEKHQSVIHPFDDNAVIAGQETFGREILLDHKDKIDYKFIPIGGGVYYIDRIKFNNQIPHFFELLRFNVTIYFFLGF